MNELYHHGILGMKWGQRRYQNPDGSLTDLGKKRYSNAWKEEGIKAGYNTDVKNVYAKAGLNGKPFADAEKSLKECSNDVIKVSKEAEDLLKDYDKKSNYYCQVAGAVNGIVSGDKTMGDIARTIWFYDNEDGDQSGYNSHTFYLRDSGKVNQAKDIYNRYEEAENKYKEEATKLVTNILGEYGDEPISKNAYNGYSVTKSIVSHMSYSAYDTYDTNIFRINEGIPESYSLKEINKYYEAEKTAKSLIAKMTKNGKSSWNLTEAVENAGLENVDFDKMSSAQWAKLESELNSLGWN